MVPSSGVGVLVAALASALAQEGASPPGDVVRKPPAISADTSEAPDLAAWGKQARSVADSWYPRVVEILRVGQFRAPTEIRIVVRRELAGIAGTSGQEVKTIAVSARWVRAHPREMGVIVHELTHAVQSYPDPRPLWLTEGIADYVRFGRFEPETPLAPVDWRKASYRDGYQTAAGFLIWLERSYDRRIVPRLNRAMRTDRYADVLFEDYTGKSLSGLWREYVAKARQRIKK